AGHRSFPDRRAERARAAVTVPRPYVLAGGLAGGLALAAAVRVAVAPALILVVLAAAGLARSPAVAAACLLALGGWWWGSVRLAALDHSVLAPRIGTAERAVVDVAEPPRRATFELRARALVLRFGP